MTYLKISEPSSVPAAQVADGAPHTAVVDFSQVTGAIAAAQRAFDGATDPSEAIKELANSVFALSGLLTEIVRGLHNRDIAIFNYPVEGTHLEQQ